MYAFGKRQIVALALDGYEVLKAFVMLLQLSYDFRCGTEQFLDVLILTCLWLVLLKNGAGCVIRFSSYDSVRRASDGEPC